MTRYRYFSLNGNLEGPLWLTQMRELYHNGRLSRRAEVCIDGTNEWYPVEDYPEIVSADLTQESLSADRRKGTRRSNNLRLAVWTWVLLAAYLTYLVVNWN